MLDTRQIGEEENVRRKTGSAGKRGGGDGDEAYTTDTTKRN